MLAAYGSGPCGSIDYLAYCQLYWNLNRQLWRQATATSLGVAAAESTEDLEAGWFAALTMSDEAAESLAEEVNGRRRHNRDMAKFRR